MQYGANLSAYERTLKVNKKEEKNTVDGRLVLKLMIYFVSSILISRVLLVNYIAPFGIAFLIAIVIYGEEKVPLVAACGSLIGYATLYSNLKEMPSYMMLVALITFTSYVAKGIGRKKQLLILFAVLFVEIAAYKLLVSKLTIGVASFTAFFEAVCIFPLYFIINYSIICFKDLKTKHLFTNEEVISMAVTVSLVISGTWGAAIYGVSLRNILALLLVLAVSYVKGSTVGAAAGVAMGVIVGICSTNLPLFVSV